MTLSISGKLFRVESAVKVSVKKGEPFVKTKLRSLTTDKLSEKSFKPDQQVKDVSLSERTLEFLYPEGKEYLFLDIDQLVKVLVSADIVGDRINFLKEGTGVSASFYGDAISTVELPQFLELMVAQTDQSEESNNVGASDVTKGAVLETGATLQVPLFVEAGDIIKVDTGLGEFIQRV
jgi:elongation factor P